MNSLAKIVATLVALFWVCPFSCRALDPTLTQSWYGELRFIPTKYTKGNKPLLYNAIKDYYEDEDGYVQTYYMFIILDEDLNVVKTFTTVKEPVMTLNIQSEQGSIGEEGRSHMVLLTQSLFDDSDSFNYVISAYDRDTQTGSYIVMNDKNEEVMRLTCPTGYSKANSNWYIDFIEINGKKYITFPIKTYNEEDSGYYQAVYRLNGQTLLPAQIISKPSFSVAPKLLRHGETVTVSLSDEFIDKGYTVDVISSKGMTVMRSKIAPGETKVNLDTEDLSRGMYVVTVNTLSGTYEATKIIIR